MQSSAVPRHSDVRLLDSPHLAVYQFEPTAVVVRVYVLSGSRLVPNDAGNR